MQDLLRIINQVANTNRATEKKEILKEHDSDTLREVLERAYNPYKRFFVSGDTLRAEIEKTPDADAVSVSQYNSMLLALDSLHNRTYTGQSAVNHLVNTLSNTHPNTKELAARILDKDLKAGLGAKTINQVFPNLVPEFNVMLASTFNPERVIFPCAVSTKLDGMRLIILYKNGEIYFKTRSGQDVPSLEFLKDQAMQIFNDLNIDRKEYLLDCEVVSGNFNDTVSLLRKQYEQATDAVVYIFDIVAVISIDDLLDGTEKSDDYLDRQFGIDIVSDSIENKELENFRVLEDCEANCMEDILAFDKQARESGFEGTIVKDYHGRWEPKRSKAWGKIKAQETHDLEIVDVQEGEGKFEGMLGALVVDYGGVHVKVGTGFSDEDRQVLWEDRDKLIGMIAEVSAQETTQDQSLRHPVFERLRTDKTKETA